MIADSIGALDTLKRAAIPFLLFKGGAQYAEGIATTTRRVLGDLDILVPSGVVTEALATLLADGWAGAGGDSGAYLTAVARIRIGINLVKGRYGEVDLHRSPFHVAAMDAAADAALWSGVRTGSLQGKAVAVAAPEASIVMSLSHATNSPGGDWAIDVATRIRRQHIDWERLADFAGRWGQRESVRAGLSFLADELGQSVPPDVLKQFRARPAPLAERVRYWSSARLTERRHPVSKQVIRQAAEAILWRRGYTMARSDRTTVAIVRRSRLAFTSPLPAASASTPWETTSTVALPPAASRFVALIMEVEPLQRVRRLRFDISVDGRLFARLRTKPANGPFGTILELPPGRFKNLFIELLGTRALRVGEPPQNAALVGPVRFRVHGVLGAGILAITAARFLRLFMINPRR